MMSMISFTRTLYRTWCHILAPAALCWTWGGGDVGDDFDGDDKDWEGDTDDGDEHIISVPRVDDGDEHIISVPRVDDGDEHIISVPRVDDGDENSIISVPRVDDDDENSTSVTRLMMVMKIILFPSPGLTLMMVLKVTATISVCRADTDDGFESDSNPFCRQGWHWWWFWK